MKVIGEFSRQSRHKPLEYDGRSYRATYEAEPGYVEIPGISEYKVRVDDPAGEPVVYMRWLVADLDKVGGKTGLLEALESHSQTGADWAACLAANCRKCSQGIGEHDAIALLAFIASADAYHGRGLGTPLAKAFAETVLAAKGVHAIWVHPFPLQEHPATGFFKPLFAPDSPAFREAQDRLEKHYERSLGAETTCPDYLRADLPSAKKH